MTIRTQKSVLKGEGVEKDHKQAVAWYRKAADKGSSYAMFNLGAMYHRGEGVEKDHKQAVEWYREAAGKGHAGAMFKLGAMYDRGEGVPEDELYLLKLFPDLFVDLGFDIETTETDDDEQAVTWYRKAAKKGHARAMYYLGLKYDKGEGVKKDAGRAVEWYRKAAAAGNAEAKKLLGARANNIDGVPSLKEPKGVRIAAVTANSVAAARGLKAGDRIIEVAQGPVSDRGAVEAKMRELIDSGQSKALIMLTDEKGSMRFVTLSLTGVARDEATVELLAELGLRLGSERDSSGASVSPDKPSLESPEGLDDLPDLRDLRSLD